MANLEKRIEALETTAGGEDSMVIIVRFVEPGHLDAEIDTLQILDGLTTWKRRPEETEQAFRERASRDARKADGIVLLMAATHGWAGSDDVVVLEVAP